MKKTRKIHITVKTRELLVVKGAANASDNDEQNVCPICRSPISLKNLIAPQIEENKSAAELPAAEISGEREIQNSEEK